MPSRLLCVFCVLRRHSSYGTVQVDSPTKRVTLQFAASVTMPEQREGVMRVTSPDRQTPISPPADSLYLSGSVIDTGRGLDVADRSKL